MGSDLVPVGDYMLVEHGIESVQDIIQDNIGGQEINEFDLDRITIPPGGSTHWQVPTLDGEESREALEGVIVFWKNSRAYWSESLEESGGGTPPDCSSDDAITGTGIPGGVCDECPHAEWGSAEGGKGQACKMIRLLFMIMPDSLLPIAVALPPTSLGIARKHFLRLAGRGVHFATVVHRLTLERTKNDAGITYSRVNFSVAKQLPAGEAQKFKEYGKMLEPVFKQVQVEHSDITE